MSESDKNIDNLFRDKFKDFELDPPDYIWKNIHKAILQKGVGLPVKPFYRGGIAGITIIIFLLGILSLLLFFHPFGNGGITNKENPALNNSSITRAINKDKVEKLTESITESKDGSEINLNTTKMADGLNSLSENNSSAISTTSRLVVTENSVAKKNISNPGHNSNSNDNQSESIIDSENGISLTNPSGSESEIQSENPENNGLNSSSNSGIAKNPDIKSDYSKNSNWSFGIYFTPEIIYNPSAVNLNNRSYSFDLHAIYTFSDYLIQSGIGLTRSTDDGNYKVDFNKYLGSYPDVYDVTFDTTGGTVTPIYHTETVNVYDSVNHYTITPAKCYYYYLQIPVLLGYGKEYKRIGWFVKGGPSLSVMIHEKESGVAYSDADKVLNITNEAPARIHTNWKFILSAGITYKLGNHFKLSVEPVFGYYLNPLYDMGKLSAKHPYSLGLRSGFLINF